MSIILSNLNFRIPNIKDCIHYNFHTQSDDCILMHAQSQSDSSWLKCYCWRSSRSVEEYSRTALSNAATWGKFVFFVLKLVLKLPLAVISQLIGLLVARLPSCSFYSPNREMWLWHAQNGITVARYQKILSASNRKHSVFFMFWVLKKLRLNSTKIHRYSKFQILVYF